LRIGDCGLPTGENMGELTGDDWIIEPWGLPIVNGCNHSMMQSSSVGQVLALSSNGSGRSPLKAEIRVLRQTDGGQVRHKVRRTGPA
jgi:hypothetical protein